MKPTLSVPIFDGEITVHGFGREHGCNFSFAGIDTSPLARSTHKEIFAALTSIPSRSDYYAPSPVQMNAELIAPRDMLYTPTGMPIYGKSWTRRRKAFPHGMYSLYRGAGADGLSGLTVDSGYVMSAADCALIVAKNGDLVIAAHAGRNSVVDMKAMKVEGEEYKKSRKNESVVHAIRNAIGLAGGNFRDTKVWVGFSISPGPHFAHAIDDERNPHNRKMVEYISSHYGPSCFKDDGQGGALGWLDNKELIRRQFVELGVREENIALDSICTYSDQNARGEPIWYSNKRQLVNGEGQSRNLIAVVKNS